MRSYAFVLFKDKKPWKGFFREIDIMNEYSDQYDIILHEEERNQPFGLAEERAVLRFLEEFVPMRWDPYQKCYRSLLQEYVEGNVDTDEAGVCIHLDVDDFGDKLYLNFLYWQEYWEGYLMEFAKDLSKFVPEMTLSCAGTLKRVSRKGLANFYERKAKN